MRWTAYIEREMWPKVPGSVPLEGATYDFLLETLKQRAKNKKKNCVANKHKERVVGEEAEEEAAPAAAAVAAAATPAPTAVSP